MNSAIYAFFKNLFWFCGRLIFRLRYIGQENLPRQGAVLLIANHASLMDPPILGCGLPRPVHYMARSTLRRIPVIGWVIERLGVLFLERDGGARAGLELGICTLEVGEVLGFFPEGTRSSDGEIGPFKRGILLMLKRLEERGVKVAVLPAGIRGSFQAWPKQRWFPRPSSCEVHFGRVMTAQDVLADRGLQTLRQQVSILAGKDPGQEGGSTLSLPIEAGESQPPGQLQAGQSSDHMFSGLGTEVPSLECHAFLLPGRGHGISSYPA